MLMLGVLAVAVMAVGKWETRSETQSFPLIHQPTKPECSKNAPGFQLKLSRGEQRRHRPQHLEDLPRARVNSSAGGMCQSKGYGE